MHRGCGGYCFWTNDDNDDGMSLVKKLPLTRLQAACRRILFMIEELTFY